MVKLHVSRCGVLRFEKSWRVAIDRQFQERSWGEALCGSAEEDRARIRASLDEEVGAALLHRCLRLRCLDRLHRSSVTLDTSRTSVAEHARSKAHHAGEHEATRPRAPRARGDLRGSRDVRPRRRAPPRRQGLACLFAERGGDLTIASPAGRRAELRELLVDLATDLGGLFDVAVDVDVDVELAHLADDADRSRNAADPASARSTTNAALDAGAPLRARAPR